MSDSKIRLKIPGVSGSPIVFETQNQTVRKVVQLLVDKVSYVVLTLGTLTIGLSLLRVSSQGWHMNVIMDVLVYGLVVLVILLSRYLPLLITGALLLILGGILAVSNFYTAGLGTVGLAQLTAISVITGAIFGFRLGLLFLLVSTIAISVAGVLIHFGHITPVVDPGVYIQSPQTWISQLSGYVFFAFMSLIIVNFIQKRLWSSLMEINQKSNALREREEKYRFLTENMRDVLFVWDRQYAFTYVSPSVECLFGYSVEEILKMDMEQLLYEDSRTLWRHYFDPSASSTKRDTLDVPLLEFEFARKDGSRFHGELKSSLIRGEKGEIVGIQGNLRDISDRKQAEEDKRALEDQLRHSEKMEAIGQLAGGVAHDFNNQLAGIMGLADMMKSKYAQEPKISAYAQGIISGVERASDLTQKLLAFARKGKYQSALIDVHVVIRDVISIVTRSLHKTIRITDQLEAHPSTIKGDPSQIENSLLNIAINARDAMPKGGELTFSTSIETVADVVAGDGWSAVNKQYLCIAVSDTGVGMTPEVRCRIFEPFFTTKDSEKGTGMGLAAVYGTVQNHDGAIDVRSEPEEGTTFRIYLPICEEVLPASTSRENETIRTGQGRILLVEDEPAVLDMTTMMLENLGYSVTACSTGAEAMRLYEDHWEALDAVVLDIILPEVSGHDVFKFIRKINSRAKVLICSGYSVDGEVQKLLDEGQADFIQKPFTIREFSRTVADLLS